MEKDRQSHQIMSMQCSGGPHDGKTFDVPEEFLEHPVIIVPVISNRKRSGRPIIGRALYEIVPPDGYPYQFSRHLEFKGWDGFTYRDLPKPDSDIVYYS